MRQPVYLDYNASAPLRPEAAEYMTSLMGPARNPSSIHSFGRSSKLIMETARVELAELARGDASGFMFTSGGTEANNTALLGFEKVITCVVEHDAVLAARPDAHKINVGNDGGINLAELDLALQQVKNRGGEVLVSADVLNAFSVLDAFVQLGLADSKGAVRRLIRGGGAKINNQVITDDAIQLTTDDFGAEGKLQLSAGKKRHAILTLI